MCPIRFCSQLSLECKCVSLTLFGKDYVDAFTLTYRYVATPAQLMNELAERFDAAPPAGLDAAALDAFRKTTRRSIQV